jgi:hypothetical protein
MARIRLLADMSGLPEYWVIVGQSVEVRAP